MTILEKLDSIPHAVVIAHSTSVRLEEAARPHLSILGATPQNLFYTGLVFCYLSQVDKSRVIAWRDE